MTATVAVESWIAHRLQKRDLFAGITTPEQRRERVRTAILEGGLADAIAGKREGQTCERWCDLFARVYGEPLEARERRTA